MLETVEVLSARLSIAEPRVLLTTREVLGMPRELTAGRRTSAYKYYGVAYPKSNTVFINVRKIPDERTLVDTIAHEPVHVRFLYLSHGRRFDRLVGRVIAGRRFTPYRKRGPYRRAQAAQVAAARNALLTSTPAPCPRTRNHREGIL